MGDAGLNRQSIAVIFARGTGDAVPFLSARLLSGQPMIYYAISAAQRSPYVNRVFVSTEDERIAAVARQGGAEVIFRPETLGLHQTPLYAAMEHAAHILHEPLAAVGGHLLCIPADAVFCNTPLITRALESYFDGDYDQFVGVLPENKKYVIWRETTSSQLERVVVPPQMRSTNERLFSEPGIITIWRVSSNTHLPINSPRIGHIVLDEQSAFRVDTEYDVWMAERLIEPPRIALRCDGSRQMGMGHIIRLATIADRLRNEESGGWTARFFVGSEHLDGARILAQHGFDVDVVRQDDVPHWVSRVEAFRPVMVINDLPFVPAQYSDQLASLPIQTLTLVDSVADIESGTAELGTVISIMDDELLVPHRQYHRGPAFAAFHPSVIARINEQVTPRLFPERFTILIAYGTGDPSHLTQPTLSAAHEVQEYIRKIFVTLPQDQQDDLFWEIVQRFGCPVEVITAPTNRLGDLLAESDLAIVSGGITAYESSALGVPSLVLCQNQRELQRMQLFERLGSIILLGMGIEVTPSQLTRALKRIFTDSVLWQRMSTAGQNRIDGRGIERISQVVKDLLSQCLPLKQFSMNV